MSSQGWNLRIVGHDRVSPSELTANPYNHRLHPQKQRDALAAAIREVGFIRSVTVNKRTGNLIDGHERVWQALAAEQPLIDVEYVDLSEEEEKKALALLDKIGELAEVDPAALDVLLREIETGEEELQALLAEMAEGAGLYLTPEAADEAELPDPPETPATKPGDLWTFGRHRLLCGSSSDFSDLKRLLGDAKPGVAVIDPPFEMAKEWTRHIMDPCIVFGPARLIRMVPDELWRFERVIDKTTKHRSATTQVAQRHAFVAQCGTVKTLPKSRKLTFDSIVSAEERPNHPHEKPVPLLVEHLTHFTPEWEVVFDPYSGSGATFMAAEAMGRACYGVERDPAYCDVIVRRWESATGGAAERGTGK